MATARVCDSRLASQKVTTAAVAHTHVLLGVCVRVGVTDGVRVRVPVCDGVLEGVGVRVLQSTHGGSDKRDERFTSMSVRCTVTQPAGSLPAGSAYTTHPVPVPVPVRVRVNEIDGVRVPVWDGVGVRVLQSPMR